MCGALKLSRIVRANVRLNIAIPMLFVTKNFGPPQNAIFHGLVGISIDSSGRCSGGPKWHSSDFKMHFWGFQASGLCRNPGQVCCAWQATREMVRHFMGTFHCGCRPTQSNRRQRIKAIASSGCTRDRLQRTFLRVLPTSQLTLKTESVTRQQQQNNYNTIEKQRTCQ